MQFSLSLYALFSLLITTASIYNAYYTRHQFYPAVIYLSTSKLNIVILGNLCFLFLVLIGTSIQRLLLGRLSRTEIEELISNSKYSITETCLALTMFREELNIRFLVLFSILLLIKIFHWLVAMRVDQLNRTLNNNYNIRLIILLLLLLIIDSIFVITIILYLLTNKIASVLLLFGIEYLILIISIWSSIMKYILYTIDNKYYLGRWNNKSTYLFYLEFTCDLVKLFLYLIFFGLICNYYGLPLHLIRELAVTLYQLRDRIIKFIQYRRITNNMNERFPDCTPEELAAVNDNCIICFESLTTAKKLPCGHMFHLHCLRTWLERSQACPTCRQQIPVNRPAVAAAANNRIGAAAAAAAPGPAPAVIAAQPQGPIVLPPLPAHLQAHLDQQAAIRAAQQQQQQQQQQQLPNQSPPPNAATTNPTAEELRQHELAAFAAAFTPLHQSVNTDSDQKSTAGTAASTATPSAGSFHSIPLPPLMFNSPLNLHPSQFQFPPHQQFHHQYQFQPQSQLQLLSQMGMGMGIGPFNSPGGSILPTDPINIALFHHQTMLLQHHIEFLQSQLLQAEALFNKQLEFQEILNKQINNNSNNNNNNHSNNIDEKKEYSSPTATSTATATSTSSTIA